MTQRTLSRVEEIGACGFRAHRTNPPRSPACRTIWRLLVSSHPVHRAGSPLGQAGAGPTYSFDTGGGTRVQAYGGNTQIIQATLAGVSRMADSLCRGLSVLGERDVVFFSGREAATARRCRSWRQAGKGLEP
jgi:hypothetical protein